jgi:hypothetical protein
MSSKHVSLEYTKQTNLKMIHSQTSLQTSGWRIIQDLKSMVQGIGLSIGVSSNQGFIFRESGTSCRTHGDFTLRPTILCQSIKSSALLLLSSQGLVLRIKQSYGIQFHTQRTCRKGISLRINKAFSQIYTTGKQHSS